MRETLYSPPGGEGPSVVAVLLCDRCKHLSWSSIGEKFCRLRDDMCMGYTTATPSWCPIVSADPETWERRLKGV